MWWEQGKQKVQALSSPHSIMKLLWTLGRLNLQSVFPKYHCIYLRHPLAIAWRSKRLLGKKLLMRTPMQDAIVLHVVNEGIFPCLQLDFKSYFPGVT